MRHVDELVDPRDALLSRILTTLGVHTLRPLTLRDLDMFSWPGPKAGEIAFDFAATDADGGPVRLRDLLG